MRDYETVFILDPKLEESEVKDEIGKVQSLITSLDGEVVGVEALGYGEALLNMKVAQQYGTDSENSSLNTFKK